MTSYGTAPPSAHRDRMAVALLAGLGAAVAGAFVWGLITYVTKHQFSLVAVLIGVAVGYAVGRFRPRDVLAAAASGVLALLGCALGTFLALIFAALGAGIGLGQVLGHLDVIMTVYPGSVGALGVVFWLLAAFLGFRTAMSGPRGRPPRPRRLSPPRPAPGYDGSDGQRLSFDPPAPGPRGSPPPGPPDSPGFAQPRDP
jgi:hypothetical protein